MDGFFDASQEGAEAVPQQQEENAAPAFVPTAQPVVVASSAPSQGSGAPAKVLEEGNALAAFNVRFRQQGEEKDAKEREGKASHKAAGKAALKKMVGERNERVATRKTANREAEKAAEQDMLNALSGESWGRVVTLMDVSGAEKAGTEKEEKKGGKGGNEKAASTEERKKAVGGVDDTIRLKDLLISLKAKPIA